MTREKGCNIVWPLLEVSLLSAILIWGIFEACYGLMQVLGLRASRNMYFVLTGHLNNPGPYGGFIACIVAIAISCLLRFPNKSKDTKCESEPAFKGRAEQGLRLLAWIALGMGALVLPATMSRAGWLASAAAIAIELSHQEKVREWIRHHRWIIPTLTLTVIVFFIGAFLLKPDSAIGRFHIWRIECLAIADRPLMGAGPGMAPWAYGEAQEAFFRKNLETVSPTIIRVAGCPDYSFNEFLRIGVEYGLPALLLSVLLILTSIYILRRSGSHPFVAGLTTWAIFALASYPLSVPQLRLMGLGFVLFSIVAGIVRFKGRITGLLPLLVAILTVGWVEISISSNNPLEFTSNDPKMVYERGREFHMTGRYEESTRLLEQGAKMSCDPMFEVIMGKNAEALGDNAKAKALYEKAHYMVPSRLYPLARLMHLQIRTGQNQAALETAQRIVAMPVNDRHAGMVQIKKETEATLDSLKNICQ